MNMMKSKGVKVKIETLKLKPEAKELLKKNTEEIKDVNGLEITEYNELHKIIMKRLREEHKDDNIMRLKK